MAGANVYPIGNNTYKVDKDKFKANLSSPIISAALSITAAGTQNAVEIPPLAIVTDVAIWNLGTTIAGATLCVGTVGDIDKFLDNVSNLEKNGIIKSGLAGTVAATPISGAYFESGGVVQLSAAAGGTDESRVMIMVWYTQT